MTDNPERSERRPANDDATEVAPGIVRIMLPIDLPGLGHVNCYALPDDRGVSLVDPGLADGVSHDVLRTRLEEIDLDVNRVHTVVTTHGHFDHFGGVARLRAADVFPEVLAHRQFGQGWHKAYDGVVHDEDSGALIERSDAEIETLASQLVRPTPWGGTTDPFPAEMLAEWSEGIDAVDIVRPPATTQRVDDGDEVYMGEHAWQVVHTPGHADDHICLWSADAQVFFAGDHVLPTITPHISGFSAYENPLEEFFRSLERVADFSSTALVLPAHGDPFTDLTSRVEAIRRHHDERLDRVRTIGAEIGEKPVEAYMRLLFRERSWGMMAASETYAHLEWLREHGDAERSELEGRLTYRV